MARTVRTLFCLALSPPAPAAGTATHTRAVHFQRSAAQAAGLRDAAAGDDGDWIVVVDVLSSDRPRSVQLTWHAHPNSTGIAFNATTGAAVVGGVQGSTGQPTQAQARGGGVGGKARGES